jgi:hypothetical protein
MTSIDRSNKFWFRNDPSLPPGYQRCFECYGIFCNEYKAPVVTKPIQEVIDYGESHRHARPPLSEWELEKRAEQARLSEREEAKRQKELERIERAEERAYASLAEGFKYRPKRCKCGGTTKAKQDARHETSQSSQRHTSNQNLASDSQVVIAGDNNSSINIDSGSTNASIDGETKNQTVRVNKGKVTVMVNGVTIRNPESSITVEKKGSISVGRSNRNQRSSSVAEQLQQISDLFFAGALSKEQFEAAKNKILGL